MKKLNPDRLLVYACMVVMVIMLGLLTIRCNGDPFTELNVDSSEQVDAQIEVSAEDNDIFESEPKTVTENQAPTEATTPTEANKLHININTADISELKKLDGIGDKMAERIVNYRTDNGNFKNIYDIKKVAGIGKKRFENIKNYIYVE